MTKDDLTLPEEIKTSKLNVVIVFTKSWMFFPKKVDQIMSVFVIIESFPLISTGGEENLEVFCNQDLWWVFLVKTF